MPLETETVYNTYTTCPLPHLADGSDVRPSFDLLEAESCTASRMLLYNSLVLFILFILYSDADIWAVRDCLFDSKAALEVLRATNKPTTTIRIQALADLPNKFLRVSLNQ